MTSQSLKKPQTTVRTFIQTIRTDALRTSLAATLAIVHWGAICQAGEPTTKTTLRPVQPLRTLPQAASSAASSSAPNAQTQWKLRWRSSHQVSPTEAQEGLGGNTELQKAASPALSLMDSAPDLAQIPSSSKTLSVRAKTPEPSIANPVRRVKFVQESIIDANAPAIGPNNSLPRIASPASDVWSDPFGDQPSARRASLPQDSIVIPPLSQPAEVPSDEPADEPAKPSNDEGLVEGQLVIPPSLGAPQADPVEAAPLSPLESITPPTTQVPSLPEEPVESPSDRSGASPSIPSLEPPTRPRMLEEAPRDASDRQSVMRNREAVGGGLTNPDFLQVDCDEFGLKMASRTIQAVSLDISPPFRPDILEEDSFDQAKAEFLESQPIRKWRDRDGKLIAEGRFIDIAFEQAIVETEDGEEVALRLSRLSQQDLTYVTDAWGLPSECQLPQLAYQTREWLPVQMTWKASNLHHKPLYFEEVNLERYGHMAGPTLQPLVSTAHFFVNIAVLPYKMGIHPPNECQYALGYYRPGNCAPWIIPPVPLSLRGAMFEAAAIGAGIGIIP